jgi:mevalonate kinase
VNTSAARNHDGFPRHFYSRGKLLIAGEYLILSGSSGLGVPVSRGQWLKWTGKEGGNTLEWITTVKGRQWFRAVFTESGYSVMTSTDYKKARLIRNLLVRASELSVTGPLCGRIETRLDFDPAWGLGSSSSLISNIAYLFDVDPFILHFAVSKGSGYDIACARSDVPVLYRLDFAPEGHRVNKGGYSGSSLCPAPVYGPVDFNPVFQDRLFFAWTGKKQDSARQVHKYLSADRKDNPYINEVTRIITGIVKAGNIQDFNLLLHEHDRIISLVLDKRPVNETMFKGFPGYVKSLGAWGGDFVMVSWEDSPDELMRQLKQKGIDIVFSYRELIYSSNGK